MTIAPRYNKLLSSHFDAKKLTLLCLYPLKAKTLKLLDVLYLYYFFLKIQHTPILIILIQLVSFFAQPSSTQNSTSNQIFLTCLKVANNFPMDLKP